MEHKYMSDEEICRTLDTCISDYETIRNKLPTDLRLGIENVPRKAKKDGYYTYKGIQIPVIIQKETYKEGIL